MVKKESIEALASATKQRTIKKRRSVEEAIQLMLKRGEQIDFLSVAKQAGCSRQYLYTHHKTQIHKLRAIPVTTVVKLDGEEFVVRTSQNVRAIEAALRKKVERLNTEIKDHRKELLIAKANLERALGEAEHWRELHSKALQEVMELRSRVAGK